MDANAVSNVLSQAVNNKQLVDAGAVVAQPNGKVVLQGSAGLAVNEGQIHADGVDGHKAGVVTVQGTQGALLASGGVMTANGSGKNSSGGSVTIKGGTSATTEADSEIEAKGGDTGDGGDLEVSAPNVNIHGHADASAIAGKLGTFKVDPDTLEIVSGSATTNQMSVADITSNTNANVLIQATGTITFDADLTFNLTQKGRR